MDRGDELQRRGNRVPVCVHSHTMESPSHRHLQQDPNQNKTKQKQKVVMKIPKLV